MICLLSRDENICQISDKELNIMLLALSTTPVSSDAR